MQGDTFLQEVARGRVSGHDPVSASGKRSIGAAGSNIDIWPGPTLQQPIPSGEIQISAVSSSADDAAGGTGVRSLEMHYLDGNDNPQSTTIDLNGTTTVTFSPTDITFIQCVHATAAGSNGKAVGDIDMSNGGTVYKRIAVGTNRCRSAMRKVPAEKQIMISQLVAGAATQAESDISLEATSIDGEVYDGLFFVEPEVVLEDASETLPLGMPIRYPPGTIITLRVATDKDALVTASWSGWFEPISIPR